jgi:hypothetical protein
MPYRKRPSKARFLFPVLQVGVPALGALFFLDKLQTILCGLTPACPPVGPDWLPLALFGAVLASTAWSAWNFYADFFLGRYYLDLDDPALA